MPDGSARSDHLAPYAVAEEWGRGRAHAEDLPGGESPFELDRSRIVNCMAFRRLMHKTQVFVTEGGDHFRTRLTHTLEVAAHAQRLARLLGLNEPLTEAIALAHDLGHPPFGHAGEAALAGLMTGHGGFEHNLQSLRVVELLEHPYPAFRGLNLTFEVRESLVKHRTLFDRPDAAAQSDDSIRRLLEAGPSPVLEGQAAALADTIAYTLHDIEDGLGECGLTEEALNQCALWEVAARPVRDRHPTGTVHSVRRPILDGLGRRLIEDAAAETGRRLREARVDHPDAVRRCVRTLAAFSEDVASGLRALQALLGESVYRNYRVARSDSKARRTIADLFAAFSAEPDLLPPRYRGRIPAQDVHRVICDYIAGMTDRYCQQEHRRLFAPHQAG